MSDDDVFIQQFESCTFPFDQWHHRAHVKLAYLYAVRYGHEVAAEKLRIGIRAYNAVNNVQDLPTSGYHETMTMAWLHVIHETIQVYGRRATADEFFDFHPQLGQKKMLRLFYSPELFMSPEAKRQFVAPDLTSLPKLRSATVILPAAGACRPRHIRFPASRRSHPESPPARLSEAAFTLMKSKRLLRLQTWTIIALFVYSLLAIWFAYTFSIPAPAKPMWQAHSYTGSEVQSLDSRQVQTYLHSAVESLDAFRHEKNNLLLVIILATFGLIGFLGWSTFMIARIKREANHAA